MSLSEGSSLSSFNCVSTVTIKEKFAFLSLFWNPERICLQNGEKCLCQRKLPLEDKSWYSVHRWSTCNAWQHIWFGCYFEERCSTCHNDSLPSTLACNVIETLPAILKGASSIAMKNQLYQSQGFKFFILASLVKG